MYVCMYVFVCESECGEMKLELREVLEKEIHRPALSANGSSVLEAEISGLNASVSITSLFLWELLR